MSNLVSVAAVPMLLARSPLLAVPRRPNASPLPMRVPVMLAAGRRRTREQFDRMAAPRREGFSLTHISEQTNLSISSVSVELQRLGDASLRRPASRARQLSDTLVGMRQRGLAMSQIGEETGLSVSSILAEVLRRGVSAPARRVRRADGSTGGNKTAEHARPLEGLDAPWPMDGRVREMRMRGGSVQEIAARLGAPPERVLARLTAMNLTTPVRTAPACAHPLHTCLGRRAACVGSELAYQTITAAIGSVRRLYLFLV
jgi:lambda repressor-like predicted transcriptional regulator